MRIAVGDCEFVAVFFGRKAQQDKVPLQRPYSTHASSGFFGAGIIGRLLAVRPIPTLVKPEALEVMFSREGRPVA